MLKRKELHINYSPFELSKNSKIQLFPPRNAEKLGLITNKLKKINSQKKYESILKNPLKSKTFLYLI